MKTLFVGDIHGKIEIMEFVEKTFPDHLKVFVGDLVDAFDRTRKQQLDCVEKALAMIQRGDTKVLLGNHELSYLIPHMRCSGYAGTMDGMMLPFKKDIWKHFDYYLWYPENKLLVTHAGLGLYIWNEKHLTLDTLGIILAQWKLDGFYTGVNGWIGKARGGVDRIGGIFWCDYFKEFAPIPGLTQVFGHTNIPKQLPPGIVIDGTNYNIDCLVRKVEFLEYDDGKFQVINGTENGGVAPMVER